MRRYEFETHVLNDGGRAKHVLLSDIFNDFYDQVVVVLDAAPEGVDGTPTHPREMALLLTKLQEACAVAKRAIEIKPENQEGFVAPAKSEPALPPAALTVVP